LIYRNQGANVIGGGGNPGDADPAIAEWARQPDKPAYTAGEVGAAAETHAHPEYLETDAVAGWA